MDFSKNVLSKSLISIFEKINGKKSTEDEKEQIEQMAADITCSQNNSFDEDCDIDDETAQILLEEEIEKVAQAIRIVVVDIVDAIIEESSFYEVKQNIPLIKESHSIVMRYKQTDLYPKIVNYAKEDMFYGEMPILEDQTPYIEFFTEYTNHPETFSILILKDRASSELVSYLDEARVFDTL